MTICHHSQWRAARARGFVAEVDSVDAPPQLVLSRGSDRQARHTSLINVKTGSSRSGTDERGKCDNVGLSAACPSNEATIHSVVVVVA